MNDLSIDELLGQSIQRIKDSLASDIVVRLDLAPIAFLRKLLSESHLNNLEFDSETEPQSANIQPSDSSEQSSPDVPSMEITKSNGRWVYRISGRTREAMKKVSQTRQLTQQETEWMIDNYFVHELIHFDQGMSGGNHSGLGVQSPQILLVIDYQADALAAVVATILAWCSPENYGLEDVDQNYNHWSLYELAIKSILWQMEIFTLLSRVDMDRDKISLMRASHERIQRIATWHYQYHRVIEYNNLRPLADFQIMTQPIIDFRNLSHASFIDNGALCRDWPSHEEALLKEWLEKKEEFRIGLLFEATQRPPLIVTGVSPFGTTRFVRHMTASDYHYSNAFKGFFDCELRASRELFTTLFNSNKWLIGKSDGWGGGDGGSQSSPFPPDLPNVTGGLAQDKDEDERMEILMRMVTPTQFPLTYMEVPLYG